MLVVLVECNDGYLCWVVIVLGKDGESWCLVVMVVGGCDGW